jgi:hypothetical protein
MLARKILSFQDGTAPIAILASLRIAWNHGESGHGHCQAGSLITAARASGGAERANYQLFIERLCSALGLPGPELAREENAFHDYVFEHRIDFKHPDGTTTSGFIDCYLKHCFVLEARGCSTTSSCRPCCESADAHRAAAPTSDGLTSRASVDRWRYEQGFAPRAARVGYNPKQVKAFRG